MQIDNKRLIELSNLESSINYIFKDKKLLNNAFIHTSYTNEHVNLHGKSNERLEFLGDAVLELVFSEIIYKYFKKVDEGILTKLRANLVCEKSFSELADKINLSDYLLLGKGEEKSGGRQKDSIKADAFEAFSGALYIDSDYEQVYNFIYDLIEDKLINTETIKEYVNDFKSMLQEHLHKYKNINCNYELIKEEGLSHCKKFYVNVKIGNKVLGTGEGKNKKLAEQMAAKDALKKMNVI